MNEVDIDVTCYFCEAGYPKRPARMGFRIFEDGKPVDKYLMLPPSVVKQIQQLIKENNNERMGPRLDTEFIG